MNGTVEIKKDGEEFPEQVKVELPDPDVVLVEPRKPNRHQRRKAAKLARIQAKQDKLEAMKRGK
jgi:UDP-3-O-[3-hydroxymyristoyl] glucosamine N-acyltransferase